MVHLQIIYKQTIYQLVFRLPNHVFDNKLISLIIEKKPQLLYSKLKLRFSIREAILRGFIKLEKRFSGGGKLESELHLPRNPIG
jgi:hypothetical protein